MDVVPSPKFHNQVVGFPVLSFIKVTFTGSGVSGITARNFAVGSTSGTLGSGVGVGSDLGLITICAVVVFPPKLLDTVSVTRYVPGLVYA